MLGYFIQTSEYHVIFMQAKDDCATRVIYSKGSPLSTLVTHNWYAYRIVIKNT